MAIEDEKLKDLLSKVDPNNPSKEDSKAISIRLDQMSSDQYSKNFIIVYGSLRKGQYNYNRMKDMFGDKSFIHIRNEIIQYAMLYDLGEYPAACHASYRHSIKGELMYCNDDVYKYIKDMELGAGYIETQASVFKRTQMGSMSCTFITYYEAGVQLTNMIRANPNLYPIVGSGDWVDYIQGVEATTLKEVNYYD